MPTAQVRAHSGRLQCSPGLHPWGQRFCSIQTDEPCVSWPAPSHLAIGLPRPACLHCDKAPAMGPGSQSLERHPPPPQRKPRRPQTVRVRALPLLPGPTEPGGLPWGPALTRWAKRCCSLVPPPSRAAASRSGASQLPACLLWPHGPARPGAQPAPSTWARGEMETQMQAQLTQLLGQARRGLTDATAAREVRHQ